MADQNKLVDFSSLIDMLYGDEKYIKEFAQAAITSFQEFQRDFTLYLLERDEVNLRKAGHKIKPVALMLQIQAIIDEYEHSKTLLWENKSDSELKKSSDRMNSLLNRVLDELKEY